ncbi:hypothetical protein, partial [Tamlana crocina]|uniref:hypothetical protein n=1 Tax=Tamlana crocina TaxID=393006 RepID=UPI001ADDB0C6
MADFPAHAMNNSGGTNPSPIDSEARKTEMIPSGEKVSVTVTSTLLMLITYSFMANKAAKNR